MGQSDSKKLSSQNDGRRKNLVLQCTTETLAKLKVEGHKIAQSKRCKQHVKQLQTAIDTNKLLVPFLFFALFFFCTPSFLFSLFYTFSRTATVTLKFIFFLHCTTSLSATICRTAEQKKFTNTAEKREHQTCLFEQP